MANIQPLVDALNALVAGQQVAGFSKHIKAPEVFKPETRGDEVQKWQDWKFAFENFVGVVDPIMAQEMKDAAQKSDETAFGALTEERKRRAEKLYSLLSSLMKNRPLRLVRGISHQNGYEAWRIIMKDMQPPTGQRSLALVQALNTVKFGVNKSISEQLPHFELMVREYERTSNSTYPDDLKVAVVLAALPASLKTNLQMIITDSTTYDKVKARIELYEQVTTQWSSDSLSMPVKATEDESTPMEVDAIWQKGGKKGKGDGVKGKFSKGKEKGKSKGWKGFNAFGKGKGKGKQKGDGKKGQQKGKECWKCGKIGHLSKNCWSKVQKVEEQPQQAPGSSAASTTNSSSSTNSLTSANAYNQNKQVKMVRIEEVEDECLTRQFDLTGFDSEDEDFSRVRVIRLIEEHKKEDEDEEFHDCFTVERQLSDSIPDDVQWVSMDIQDVDETENALRVNTVKSERLAITLDSGADVSVVPEEFAKYGDPGSQGLMKMVDAQGERIETSGNRKMKIEAEMRHGGKVEFIENFAVGAVSHPILCFGKLLRQGWVISKDGSELFMNHPTGAEVPIRLERNSLGMDVQIRAITVEKKEEADGGEEMRVLALQGFVSRELEQLSLSPGWHVLPNGVAAYSDPVALNFMDPRGNFDVEWPARMTLMKVHDGTGHWVQVENTKDYRATDDNPYRKLTADNQSQRTLTFVAPAKLQDYFVSGAEVPVSMYPRMGEEIPDWPDSEDEVGEFVGMGAEGEGAPPGGFEIEMHEEGEMEVMLDEDTLNMDTRLKDLQEWHRKLGLATSGSKMKCLKRLQKFKLLEEQKLAIDLSKRLYEESQREAIPLQVPKLPSRVDQDSHNLTHIPFASWCQCCVATRAKEDARRDEERGDKTDRGKSVISFDYGFTYMQGEEEEKQFGTCLYMAESETKAVHAVPALAKGGVSLKQVTEEIVRFSMATSSSNSIILMADGERSTRQILRAVQHWSSTWFAYRSEDNRS